MDIFFALAFKSVNYLRRLCVTLMQILFRREQTVLDPKGKVCFFGLKKRTCHCWNDKNGICQWLRRRVTH